MLTAKSHGIVNFCVRVCGVCVCVCVCVCVLLSLPQVETKRKNVTNYVYRL